MTLASSSVRHGLREDELNFYQREGYVIRREPLFPADQFQRLAQHFDEKLARLPVDVRPESMDVPHFTDLKLFEWLFSDEVLDLVEPIVGPDIVLFSSHFICKPKGNGKKVPWHEDSFYWKGQMEPMEVATVWLAIDPSTKENGCMYVIPRTQDNGYSDYEPVDAEKNVFPTEIKKFQFDESKKVPIELQPNQCSIHDGRLIHGSPPNTSAIRRCGYTMRYTSAKVKYNQERIGPYHEIYLARGQDRAGNKYGDPTRAYPQKARYREENKKGGH